MKNSNNRWRWFNTQRLDFLKVGKRVNVKFYPSSKTEIQFEILNIQDESYSFTYKYFSSLFIYTGEPYRDASNYHDCMKKIIWQLQYKTDIELDYARGHFYWLSGSYPIIFMYVMSQ